jgi:esterase/lipase superfamily enzyme
MRSDEKPFSIDAAGHASADTFSLQLGPLQATRDAIKEGYAIVRVYYATDRAPLIGGSVVQYANERAGNNVVSYGMCEVSIPRNHRFAEVEAPSVWRLEFHSDPEKHMTLQTVRTEPIDSYFQDVAKSVEQSPGKEAFIFVHGYNVGFEDAALRTAQLAYDFGFKGAPIFYSWPSRDKLLGYLDDEKTVNDSVANLRQFIEEVANRSGATVIHVIAHSMGNRALLPALAQLAQDRHFKNFAKFHGVVLAAPDVDKNAFINWVGQIKLAKSSVALYVSDRDQALLASRLLFNSQERAGVGGTHAIVIPGMDTIDVSKVSMDALGHSYYGDNPNVVTDLLMSLKGQPAPRPGLTRVSEGSLAYWLMTARP